MHAPHPIPNVERSKMKMLYALLHTIKCVWCARSFIFIAQTHRCPACIVMALMNTYRQFARILFNEKKESLVRAFVFVSRAHHEKWKLSNLINNIQSKRNDRIASFVSFMWVRALCACAPTAYSKGRWTKTRIYYRLTNLWTSHHCVCQRECNARVCHRWSFFTHWLRVAFSTHSKCQ